MHGLLADTEAMSHIQKYVKNIFPDLYIKNVEVGDGRSDSMFLDINDQVKLFATQILNDTNLKNGFNAIGHSQGGLLTRAYVERYNQYPVYNLISLAGPHDGVFGVPDFNYYCPDQDCPWLINIFDVLMNKSIVEYGLQIAFSFAAYWKNPLNYQGYLDNNIFLADINNERPVKNANYKKNLMSLNKYLLMYAEYDRIVVPQHSPWFEFFKIGQDIVVEQFNQTQQYTDDSLGLRTMYQQNKLIFTSAPCGHQEIPNTDCIPTWISQVLPLINNTLN